jgi:ring-1,2-phenylacetyl-CoA epoxidase subunit PaaD
MVIDAPVTDALLAPRRTASGGPAREGDSAVTAAWQALGGVPDPEVPVVSIVELGIVRSVAWSDDTLCVTLTPTYSGCPATEMIERSVRDALHDAHVRAVRVDYRLAPAWTTDWLAPEARERLRAVGIAPPGGAARIDVTGISPLRRARQAVPCPRCGSGRTALLSQFGSTACKAQYRCADCLEPFDYFKPH